ncbi:MAG: hypothetical protein GX891_00435 [Clostridiales bacterium]|nr:hypothetical protein [Clostridiales bacterium]
MRYFGTDGIRGKAEFLMSERLPQRLGRAIGDRKNVLVAVARDNRESSFAIEKMFVSELIKYDAHVLLLGELPTPALALIAQQEQTDYAVMITASHNPPEYNGLKVFGKNGEKLSPKDEKRLDSLLFVTKEGSYCGTAKVVKDGRERYISHLKSVCGERFDGENVTLDCCHGATAGIADLVLSSLGANVTALNTDKNPRLINVGCGSTNIKSFAKLVPAGSIGFAFDGDGDRMLCAYKDKPFCGDAILLTLSKYLNSKGLLKNRAIAITELSSKKLDEELLLYGIKAHRTPVGDKYVLDEMKSRGLSLGGERSGHFLLRDFMPSGDGILAALMYLKAKKAGFEEEFVPYPRFELDIPIPGMEQTLEKIKHRIDEISKYLGKSCRFLVRKSGTEPVLRVMAEGNHPELESVLEKFKEYVEFIK